MKVYIDQMAAVSAFGDTWEQTWQGLLSAESCAKTYLGRSSLMSCEVAVATAKNLCGALIPIDEAYYGRSTALALNCYEQLLTKIDANIIRFYGGSTHGEADLLIDYNLLFDQRDNEIGIRLQQSLRAEIIPKVLASISLKDFRVGAWVYSSCVSSLHALAIAAIELENSSNSKTVVLGVDANNDLEIGGFQKIGAIAPKRCRPFAMKPEGILIGEGAAALTLVSHRPNQPIAVIGIGISCDAGSATHPDKEGKGLEICIYNALNNAAINFNDLGAIISHGTGTPANDGVEGSILRKFHDGWEIPFTSVKGVLGHTMGASGLFNVLVAVQALKEGILPPASGENYPIQHGLHLVNGAPYPIDTHKPVLVLASGFGGNNVALILRHE